MTSALTIPFPDAAASVVDDAMNEAITGRDARITELTGLIGQFSGVVDRLQTSQASLTEKVSRLQQELAEKNRLLSDKQKQLERRNRLAALGEMAAGLAHEIRNPLGGIGLYAGMLAEDLADDGEASQLINRIRDGVARLERTVSQVLRFAGEVEARPELCDAAALVRDVIELCRSAGAKRGVDVRVTGPSDLPATVDADLASRAVMNLVLNAVDVAERIEVCFDRCEEGRLRVRVSDDGPGLPSDVDAERLFDPFFTTKDAGTGLGLSIVHRIAEAHGGTVTARNGERGGAVFELML